MNVLRGFYSSLIMYLDPRGYDSSLKTKTTFGRKSGWFYTYYKSAIGCSIFATGSSVLEITHRMTK